MAGEKKGKTYEAITYLALEALRNDGRLKDKIFWNHTPSILKTEPDFTIGQDPENPARFIMVTHGGSVKESNRKYWRNLGEANEAKSLLALAPRVYSLIFDGLIKEDIKKIEEKSFDGHLVVGDTKYGKTIRIWVDSHLDSLPQDQAKKVSAIEKAFAQDKSLAASLVQLTNDIDKLIRKSSPELAQLWNLQRRFVKSEVGSITESYVRRGFTKAALLGFIPAKEKCKVNAMPVHQKLGLVRKTLSGYQVSDQELLWLTSSPFSDISIEKLISVCGTAGFRNQLAKVLGLDVLAAFSAYVIENSKALCTEKGMLASLRALRKDPGAGLKDVTSGQLPSNIWLFDYIGAIVKASNEKAQAFGYSTFAKHVSANTASIGSMNIGDWCSCFMNQYFSRRENFNAPAEAEKFVARVLAEQFSKVSSEVENLTQAIETSYIAKEYEATLLSHRGFDPILGLIRITTGNLKLKKEKVRGAFAERTFSSGNSGSSSVLWIQNTMVVWQSVTDAGRDHKRKELCGRAVALRFTWNAAKKEFETRPRAKKLVLIVDGTWRKDDIDSLARAGWDSVISANDISNLASEIV